MTQNGTQLLRRDAPRVGQIDLVVQAVELESLTGGELLHRHDGWLFPIIGSEVQHLDGSPFLQVLELDLGHLGIFAFGPQLLDGVFQVLADEEVRGADEEGPVPGASGRVSIALPQAFQLRHAVVLAGELLGHFDGEGDVVERA